MDDTMTDKPLGERVSALEAVVALLLEGQTEMRSDLKTLLQRTVPRRPPWKGILVVVAALISAVGGWFHLGR